MKTLGHPKQGKKSNVFYDLRDDWANQTQGSFRRGVETPYDTRPTQQNKTHPIEGLVWFVWF